MYSLIRKIHLFSSLILAVFILLYFATGTVMIFESFFVRAQQETKTRLKLPEIHTLDNKSKVQLLQERLAIHGQYSVRQQKDRVVVNFMHPGTTTEVSIPLEGDSIFMTSRKGNMIATLHQFHRLHGYHGGLIYWTWALMYDLSATSMIVFALSGLYLWYRTERRRLTGWIVLGASTALTAVTILYLMFIA
jgi:hypothetical protein